ncbi:MAG: oligosaccharide flippase family protein, partial [Planctomycetaceae bacterium]|nr:oligosaccharide flippase family protein [Planctomycetaceae bacterium]
MSGQAVAMTLPILAAPVLSRLYSPSDYGTLGLFLSVSSVLIVVSAFQFSRAIIVERRTGMADSLISVCLISTLFTSLLSVIPAAIVVHTVFRNNSQSSAAFWFWLTPLLTFMSGLTETCLAVANRHQQYRLIAVVRAASAVVCVGTSLTLGIFGGQS